jgi:hypothetical protein
MRKALSAERFFVKGRRSEWPDLSLIGIPALDVSPVFLPVRLVR